LKRNLLMTTLLMLTVLLLSACTTERFQHIEVFVAETSEQNEDGFYEPTGYKKINAITTVEEGEHHVATDVKAIEDFFDTDGNYIRTEIIHSAFSRSKVTNTEDGDEHKKVLQEPATILIPAEARDPFHLEKMTEEERERVKQHVLSFTDTLG